MKQLDRLLFEQGGDCFFCKQPLQKADASIEHLHAVANGGTSAEENVVACCKAINALLSNKPLKEKFGIVLRQKAGFRCPADKPAQHQADPTPLQATSPAELPAKAKASPAPQTSPRPGPAAVRAPKLVSIAVPAVLKSSSAAVTCPTCRTSVASAVGQIDYVCPHCKGAFRY